jgi:hypothetical protein
MSAPSGNSGVRNLRAMFENKGGDQSTSPPSRGRSPSGSINSGSSRPVSKVRASFVAVERPGDIGQAPQWGLRKASDVSSMAEVKDADANGLTRTSTVENPSTIGPPSPHISKDSIDGGLGTILKGSAFEGHTPKKPAQEPQSKPSPTTQASNAPDKAKQSTSSTGVGSRAAEMIKRMQPDEKPGPPPTTTTTVKTTPGTQPLKNPHPKPMVKPSPVSPKSPKVEQSALKTPTSPRTAKSMVKGGPAKIKGVMESAKRANEARESIQAEQSKPMPKEIDTQPKPKVNGVKKEAITSPKSATSPRSPTKPAKLPSAATATTAAAAAKHDSQQPTQQPVRRSVPRASLPVSQPRATTATTASALAKKSSRASLAATGNDQPKARVSMSKPDEGFLARMMRPTQSSSQKTHEKVQVNSPPRAKSAATKGRTATSTGPKESRKSDQSDGKDSRLDDVTDAPGTDAAAEPEQGDPVLAAEEPLAPQQGEVHSSANAVKLMASKTTTAEA